MITKITYGIEDLKNCDDEKLVGLIFDKACELHFGTFGENLAIAQQAHSELFATWTLDFEVKNGGFDQFFLNKGIDVAESAKQGMSRIGATKLVDLIARAIKIYQSQSAEFSNKRNPEFDSLDIEFYAFEELEELQLRYVKSNLGEFVITER